MTFSTTPRGLTKTVRAFCGEVEFGKEPVYVAVDPQADAKENDCFVNVERKVKDAGGTCQYGWVIWEWEGVMLEAEFHAIWVSQDGKRLDVTPKADHETRILFLPSDMHWQRTPICNIRKALWDNPHVHEFIRLHNEFHEVRLKHVKEDGLYDVPESEAAPFESKLRESLRRIHSDIRNRQPTAKERAEKRKQQRRQEKKRR